MLLFSSTYACTRLLLRPEDHRWRPHPVCEEALRRDDPDRLLPERLRPHRPAAFHGEPAAEVRLLAHRHVQRHQQLQELRLGGVHQQR